MYYECKHGARVHLKASEIERIYPKRITGEDPPGPPTEVWARQAEPPMSSHPGNTLKVSVTFCMHMTT